MALDRTVSLPLLIFYGVGTMVGGGFYALIGKVAGDAGMAAPYAFAISAILALISGFSFSELASRFPVSASVSRYTLEAFKSEWFAAFMGWMVVLTGVVSAATLSVAIVGFLQDFIPLQMHIGVALVVFAMAAIAIWGISESVLVATVITVIEVGGLLFIMYAGSNTLLTIPERLPELMPSMDIQSWVGIFSGAFLAFYAFLGFEDMVTIAEEVKDARRNIPIAIFVSIAITTFLYIAVSLIAVLAISPAELAVHNTPMSAIVNGANPITRGGLIIVSILAGVNGALVQIVMSSRMIYGMAKQDGAPSYFSRINPLTQTPIRASVLVALIILALALFLPLTTLAKATSTIILGVFAVVNLSLIVIKKQHPTPPKGALCYPVLLPILGFVSCAGFIVFRFWIVFGS